MKSASSICRPWTWSSGRIPAGGSREFWKGLGERNPAAYRYCAARRHCGNGMPTRREQLLSSHPSCGYSPRELLLAPSSLLRRAAAGSMRAAAVGFGLWTRPALRPPISLPASPACWRGLCEGVGAAASTEVLDEEAGRWGVRACGGVRLREGWTDGPGRDGFREEEHRQGWVLGSPDFISWFFSICSLINVF